MARTYQITARQVDNGDVILAVEYRDSVTGAVAASTYRFAAEPDAGELHSMLTAEGNRRLDRARPAPAVPVAAGAPVPML